MKKQVTEITFFLEGSKQVNLTCEVAKSFLAKTKGLMNREHLPKNEGMIFPFMLSQYRFFWMKNVKIPLDFIFVNKNLEIISICEAPVEHGFLHKIYWSRGFCKYVIECNMGFCKEHKITKGTKIGLIK